MYPTWTEGLFSDVKWMTLSLVTMYFTQGAKAALRQTKPDALFVCINLTSNTHLCCQIWSHGGECRHVGQLMILIPMSHQSQNW